MKQQSVIDALTEEGVAQSTIHKFLDWHHDNPQVWHWFERFTLEAIDAGKQLGAKAIFERCRWEAEIKTTCAFKCNNNYAAYLGRVFMIKYPDFHRYFKTRTIRGLKVAA